MPTPTRAARARVLLIDGDSAFVVRFNETVDNCAWRRLWIWHEPSVELGVTLLAVSRFDVVLLALPRPPVLARQAVHAIAESALGTPMILLYPPEVDPAGLDRIPSSVVGILSKEDTAGLWRTMAEAVGMDPTRAVKKVREWWEAAPRRRARRR